MLQKNKNLLYRIIIHPRAENKQNSAIEWYEEIAKDFGVDFLIKVQGIINNLEIYQLMYGVRKKNFREAVLKEFPYLIVYKVFSKIKEVHVLSIFNTYQKPAKKYRTASRKK